MIKKGPSLREALEAALQWIPDARMANGRPNTSALERHFEKKGAPLSQSTLHRLFADKSDKPRKLDAKTIEALHAVLKIPRSILRGEAMSADTERAMVQYGLDVFLLAQKIAELPVPTRELISRQIDELLIHEQDLKKSFESGNVTPLHRKPSS